MQIPLRGTIYLGVENDVTITRLHKAHRDYTRLAAYIVNKTVPPVLVRVELLEETLSVLSIHVPNNCDILEFVEFRLHKIFCCARSRPNTASSLAAM